jgi:Transposase
MYTRADISLEDRLEIFSHYWRFQDEYGTVSRLAEEWRISRHFIYEVAERVREALDWRRAGRPAEDRAQEELEALGQRVRELEADCEQLSGQLEVERARNRSARFRLLLELALAPVSEDKIVRCLEAAFGRDGRCSVGWVSEQLQRAGGAALAVMQGKEVSQAVEEMALDEIFRHRQPILMAVDPQTLLALVPQAAEDRKGETWQTVLEQYPNLKFVVSDQASGLLKGVQETPQQIAHQYDLFHFKRELRRWLRSLEARCYEAMEQVEKARKLIDAPRLLSSARIQAVIEYRQQAAALDLRLEAFDWVELIVTYLEEQFEVYDQRRQKLRTRGAAEAAIDEVLGLLREVGVINTKPLISTIEGARTGLFTFFTVLEEKFEGMKIEWRHIEGSRQAVYEAVARCWYWRSRAHTSAWSQHQYLAALVGLEYWQRRVENFSAVQREVYEALDRVVRASSAVECLNSLLRPYISVKKHLSQGFLALIALYWNTRPLKQRGNQTPFQLSGVDLGGDDWVDLIEHQLRKQDYQPVKRAA